MSTFHKRQRARVKIGQIKGTKPSLYNNQLLVSTGIPSLDVVIGGGLGVGTVLLVEEDTFSSYARLMVKYFAAEAVMTQQSLFLCGADFPPDRMVKELPAPIEGLKAGPDCAGLMPSAASATSKTSSTSLASSQDLQQNKMTESSQDKMKIAWRYQSQPKFQNSVSGTKFGHYYDLTKTMDDDKLKESSIHMSACPLGLSPETHSPSFPGMNRNYCHLLHEIKAKIESGQFSTSADSSDRSILRIGIHSLGSPLWGETGGVSAKISATYDYDPSLALFLMSLRAMLRSAFAVAFITVPTHLFYDVGHVHRIERLCDTVIRLESFAGSSKEKNPVFKEYHGLVHLLRLARVNALVPPNLETTDLAFKLRRKKFVIEKLHLPPELMDSTGRSQDDDYPLTSKHLGSSCGSHGSSRLDF